MSFVINLGNDSNVDIVIPVRLKTMQRRLERYTYCYRKDSKERAEGDKKLIAKTQIRIDQMSDTLLLGIHKTKDADWKFYKEKDLPKIGDESRDGFSEELKVEVVGELVEDGKM